MAQLTTHVLDTSRGVPAAGMTIDLHLIQNNTRTHITRVVTNTDGRASLLSGETNAAGVYELTFHAGDYFRSAGIVLTAPPFLDDIVIRFGISDANGKLHVPLLLSPFSYSTYRGS